MRVSSAQRRIDALSKSFDFYVSAAADSTAACNSSSAPAAERGDDSQAKQARSAVTQRYAAIQYSCTHATQCNSRSDGLFFFAFTGV